MHRSFTIYLLKIRKIFKWKIKAEKITVWKEARIWCGTKQPKPALPLLFNLALNYTYSRFLMRRKYIYIFFKATNVRLE